MQKYVAIAVAVLLIIGTVIYKQCKSTKSESILIDTTDSSNSTALIDTTDSSNSTATGEPVEKKVSGTFYIHVAGEVKKPGIYELKEGKRVNDAIEAAGGTTDKGDLANIRMVQRAPVYNPEKSTSHHIGPVGHPKHKTRGRLISLADFVQDGSQIYIPAKFTVRDVINELKAKTSQDAIEIRIRK